MSEEFKETSSSLPFNSHSEVYSLVQTQEQLLRNLNVSFNDLKVETNNLKNDLKTLRDENFFLEIQLLNERKKNRIYNQKTSELIASDISLMEPNTPLSNVGGIACLNGIHEKRSFKKSLEDSDSNLESKLLKFDESASFSIPQHGISSKTSKKPAGANCVGSRGNIREDVYNNVRDGTNNLEMADKTGEAESVESHGSIRKEISNNVSGTNDLEMAIDVTGEAERSEFETRPKSTLLTSGEHVIREYANDPMGVEQHDEILQQLSGRCNMDYDELD